MTYRLLNSRNGNFVTEPVCLLAITKYYSSGLLEKSVRHPVSMT
jgi:hypothetical protein